MAAADHAAFIDPAGSAPVSSSRSRLQAPFARPGQQAPGAQQAGAASRQAPKTLICTIAVSGSGSTLGFPGAANNGTATGAGTITYTDGSTQPFTLSLADWRANAAAGGGDIVATMPYINNQSGTNISRKASAYHAPVALQPGKTVAYITLPDISQGVANGQGAMHIFAVSVG